MLIEFAQAITSIKSMTDIATLMSKMKTDSAVIEKAAELHATIISLQSAILTIQAEHQSLLTKNNELKQKIVDIENWKTEAANYSLKNIRLASFVYASNPNQTSSEPPHWICAKCYQDKKKSILQRGEQFDQGYIYHCNTCGANIIGPRDLKNT